MLWKLALFNFWGQLNESFFWVYHPTPNSPCFVLLTLCHILHYGILNLFKLTKVTLFPPSLADNPFPWDDPLIKFLCLLSFPDQNLHLCLCYTFHFPFHNSQRKEFYYLPLISKSLLSSSLLSINNPFFLLFWSGCKHLQQTVPEYSLLI